MSPSASAQIADIGEVSVAGSIQNVRMVAVGQHAAGAPDRLRAVARAGAVGRADIQRNAGDDEIRIAIVARDAEESQAAIANVGVSVMRCASEDALPHDHVAELPGIGGIDVLGEQSAAAV